MKIQHATSRIFLEPREPKISPHVEMQKSLTWERSLPHEEIDALAHIDDTSVGNSPFFHDIRFSSWFGIYRAGVDLLKQLGN